MLPVGKYRLSLSWNSNMANMKNRSTYKINEASTTVGETTDAAKTLTYDFEITDVAAPFDLTFGFQKTGTDNTPAQIIVDDIVLTYSLPFLRGDANGDNKVNMSDVTSIVNYILGTPAGTFNEAAADANYDGEIGMSDVMFIVQYILNGIFPDK